MRDNSAQFVPLVAALGRTMDKGEFSIAIRPALPRFSGTLFRQPLVLASPS